MIVSDAQAAANRANAQASTGPRTLAGKARVRRNAHRHGLYAENAPDAGEDALAFGQLYDDFLRRFMPDGAAETALVARIAAITWRLARVPAAEHAVYAGHEADFIPADDPGENPIAVDLPDLWGAAHRAGNFDSPIARINRHEAHLQRMHQRTLEMLNTLQALRTNHDPLTAAKTTARRVAMSGPPAWAWYYDDDLKDDAPQDDDTGGADTTLPTGATPPHDLHARAAHIEDLAAAHNPLDGVSPVPPIHPRPTRPRPKTAHPIRPPAAPNLRISAAVGFVSAKRAKAIRGARLPQAARPKAPP